MSIFTSMPSINPSFQYDIFISYRHNDNRSGWVTDFVNALQEELAATIKEPLSIYFDKNPHDGLLETHSVDKSLEGKLKCLIFIPIISQTYCDTKSFAWQHEFCAFNKLTQEDQFGRDIKLKNGNVASRILPVQIHDLEEEDKSAIEYELGGVLRSVEFIYQSAGVIRPLLQNEIEPKANLKRTYYRDQLNKTVRGIKEIIMAMQSPSATVSSRSPMAKQKFVPSISRKKLAWIAAAILTFVTSAFGLYYFGGYRNNLQVVIDKSIAVIPFTNLNNDKNQDYLSDGIAEDIRNHLVKIEDLKVKSRTSTLQYKNTDKTIDVIGEELGVGTILEGTVRRVGDQIRITVDLIDVETDIHLWSETYTRDMKDVLKMQSEIALEIANVLKAQLSDEEKSNIASRATNSAGYEYFLRARQWTYSSNTNKNNYLTAMKMVDKAINLDPKLVRAYALKGEIWFMLAAYGIPMNQWKDSSLYYANKSIELDGQQVEGYLLRSKVLNYLNQFKEAKIDLRKVNELAPNNPEVMNAVGFQYLRDGNKKGADMILRSIEQNNSRTDPNYFLSWFSILSGLGDIELMIAYAEKLRELDPGSNGLYWNLTWMNITLGKYESAIKEAEMGRKLNPDSYNMIDVLGWAYYNAGKYEQAEATFNLGREFERGMEDTTQHVPFRLRLGMAKLKLGKKKEAEALFREQQQLDEEQINGKRGFGVWGGNPGAYYDLAAVTTMLGDKKLGVQYLDSAFTSGMGWYDGYSIDHCLRL
jgi:TolB-like protein/Flp pilus assembly protein TadD